MATARKRLFTLGSVLSLLMCLATMGLWMRSHRYADYAWTPAKTTSSLGTSLRIVFLSRHGTVTMYWSGKQGVGTWGVDSRPIEAEDRESLLPWSMYGNGAILRQGSWAGITYLQWRGFLGVPWSNARPQSQPMTVECVVVPYVWVALLWIAAPVADIALALVRRLRVRDYKAQRRCLACGYSLRGNTSGVCPECGTAVTQDPAQARNHGRDNGGNSCTPSKSTPS
jgi:hypothetical protein